MQIFVLFGGRTKVIEVKETDTANDLKKLMIGEEFYRMVLWSQGKAIPGTTVMGKLLSFYHLEWTMPIAGGKVHGSLARAGKVKGQTPNVKKMEKSKRLTGRAKRRQQFNKRFMQTTATLYHRARGPNSQTMG
uniref:40S ribosomal protein S30 n=1 Tax=Anopheles christyi TaxID=43041 RepID=A0A182JQ28_9DIPT